jgi:hypothetical protein
MDDIWQHNKHAGADKKQVLFPSVTLSRWPATISG